MKKLIAVGDVFTSNEGSEAKVIEFINSRNVVIEFNDKYKHVSQVQAGNLRSGNFRNPFHPSVFGVGFIGTGKHKVSVNGKHTDANIVWKFMLQRCYSNQFHARQPTYSDCTVHEDWHNFQEFAEWYYNQEYSQTDGFELDKDLSVVGNKIYSERHCSFVPQEINKLFNDSKKTRGDLPQGVTRHGGVFRARINKDGKEVFLGSFKTPDLASAEYVAAKRYYAQCKANEYKDVISKEVYANMMTYHSSS